MTTSIKPSNKIFPRPSKVKEYSKLPFSFKKNEKYSEPNLELFSSYRNLLEEEKKILESSMVLPDNLVRRKNKIKNKLIEKNQPLVSYMINKYYNKIEYKKYQQDLFQEGVLGLMSAIDGYDLSLGYKFSTYSTWWIRQAINTYIADFIPIINVPPHIRAARNKLLKNVGQHEDEFSTRLTQESDKLGYTKKMTKAIISALDSKKVLSVSSFEQSNDDDHQDSFSFAEPSVKPVSEEKSDSKLLINAVSNALNKMSDKNKNILLLRFNVLDEKDLFPKEKSVNDR